MMLWERMSEPCYLVEPVRTADGEGGFHTIWSNRAKFNAAVINTGSIESDIAGKTQPRNSFKITTPYELKVGQVIKRVKDGLYIRVTSDPVNEQTPAAASFSFYQANGEEWRLPDGD